MLTTSMSADSAVINGMCTESLAPMAEGNCAIFGGIIIGMIYCWPMGIVCLVMSPVMVIGNMLEIEFMKAAQA